MTESFKNTRASIWDSIDEYLWMGVDDSVESSGCLTFNPSQS